MSNESTPKAHSNYIWLICICAVLALLVLGLLYHLLADPKYTVWQSLHALAISLIPNLVAALTIFLLLYWLFERRGLVPSQLDRIASEERIIRAISNAITTSTATQGVRVLYPSFKQVDWTTLLGETNLRIDIVVNYFDSWVKDNELSLIGFFGKPKSEMHLYLPDPDSQTLMSELYSLYSEYSENVIQEKVRNTEKRLLGIIESAGAKKSQLTVCRLSCRPTYALQRLDNRLAVFSAFDNGRKMGVESPAVVIDLQKIPQVSQYFERELQYLQSKKVGVESKERIEGNRKGIEGIEGIEGVRGIEGESKESHLD